MSRVVLDTNVASLVQRGRLPAGLAARLPAGRLALSFVTVGELTQWAEVYDWGRRRRGRLDLFIAQTLVVGGGEPEARVWGRLMAAARRRGRPRPPNDTWIAACCIAHGYDLVTHDLRDFADFAEHDGLGLVNG